MRQFQVAPRSLLVVLCLATAPGTASAQGSSIVQALLGSFIPGLGQQILGTIHRCGDDKQRKTEDDNVAALMKANLKTTLAPFANEAQTLQRLQEAEDVGRRAQADVHALLTFTEDDIRDHLTSYDSVAQQDMATHVMKLYETMDQVLHGGRFVGMTNEGVADDVLTPLREAKETIDRNVEGVERELGRFNSRDVSRSNASAIIRAVLSARLSLWDLDKALIDLAIKLSSRVDIYRRDIDKAVKSVSSN